MALQGMMFILLGCLAHQPLGGTVSIVWAFGFVCITAYWRFRHDRWRYLALPRDVSHDLCFTNNVWLWQDIWFSGWLLLGCVRCSHLRCRLLELLHNYSCPSCSGDGDSSNFAPRGCICEFEGKQLVFHQVRYWLKVLFQHMAWLTFFFLCFFFEKWK